jgi:hypothetical protein
MQSSSSRRSLTFLGDTGKEFILSEWFAVKEPMTLPPRKMAKKQRHGFRPQRTYHANCVDWRDGIPGAIHRQTSGPIGPFLALLASSAE